MAVLFLGTRFQSFKNDGTVNAGGTVYFYDTGTSTAKTTYSDSALTVANANPVVLNSAGAADIWYSGNADVTVKDSTGTTLDTFTSINPSTTATTTAPNIITNGSFEELAGTEPSGWTQTLYTGGTGTQDADSIHGYYAWKFTSVGNGGGYITTNSAFLVAYNRPILLYWDMKGTADVRNVVDVLWYDDTDALLSTTTAYDNSTTNPTSYTRKYYTATPPSNAVTAKVRLYGCHSSDSTSGNTFYDNLYIVDAGFLGAPLTFTASLWMAEGAAVASANDCNIWTTDGNTVHITGTTEIQDWGTAPQAGAWKWVIFDDALQLTYNATTNKTNTGGVNYTTVAGDRALVYADDTGTFVVTIYPLDGLPPVSQSFVDVQTFTGSGTWTKPSTFASTSKVLLQAWGGGGGGANGNGVNDVGGGGGGAYMERWLLLSDLGATETITIGAGGTGSVGAGSGTNGGNTTIGSLLTAYGGAGGETSGGASGDGGGGGGIMSAGSSSTGGTLGGGAGGVSTANGSIPTHPWGGAGGAGVLAAGGNTTGGAAVFGGGGGSASGTTAATAGGTSLFGGAGGFEGTAGSQPGGGGGARKSAAGSNGGAGKVIITTFG